LEGITVESRVFRELEDEWWTERFGYEVTPRKILQLVGTEAMRVGIHNDLWIYSLERQLDPAKDYVITDMRFPNELKMVNRVGGKSIFVQRGRLPDWWGDAMDVNGGSALALTPPVHVSEWALAGALFDHHIYNDSTLEELYIQVDDIVNQMR
jgi:hypothetical protein